MKNSNQTPLFETVFEILLHGYGLLVVDCNCTDVNHNQVENLCLQFRNQKLELMDVTYNKEFFDRVENECHKELLNEKLRIIRESANGYYVGE